MSRQPARRFAPAAVFGRTNEPMSLPADIRLRGSEWGVLFSATGRHTVAQLGAMLQMHRQSFEESILVLVQRGLIEERSLSIEEYLAAAATVGDTDSITAAEFLRAREGLVCAPLATTHTAPELQIPRVLEDDDFEPLPVPDLEGISMPNASTPTTVPQAARSLSLLALMRTLLERAGDPDAGQLDVYRTFLRIEPQLLRSNGITTLRFEDDRIVRDPDLVAAIVASAAETLGAPVPEDVFVS